MGAPGDRQVGQQGHCLAAREVNRFAVDLNSRRAKQERELIDYERYIDLELSKTARQVQGMDIMVGLMCWLAGTLAYLSVAAVADHWLISGGLGTAGRWLALVGLLTGSGWFP